MRKRGEKTKCTKYDMMYGSALRQLRLQNFTQEEVAKKLNITTQMYASYERGIAKISIAMENELANIFEYKSRSDFAKKIEETQEFFNIK